MRVLQATVLVSVMLLLGAAGEPPVAKSPPKVTVDVASFEKVLATGQLLVASEPGFDERHSFLVAQGDDAVHCLDAQGKELWKAKPGEAPFKLLGSFGGIMVLAASDQIAGVDENSGQIVWKMPRPGGDAKVVVAGDVVLTQSAVGLEGRAVATGEVRWKQPITVVMEGIERANGKLILQKAKAKDSLVIDTKTGITIPLEHDVDCLWVGASPSGEMVTIKEELVLSDPKSAVSPPVRSGVLEAVFSIPGGRQLLVPLGIQIHEIKQIVDGRGNVTKLNPPRREGPTAKSDGKVLFIWNADDLVAVDLAKMECAWSGRLASNSPPIRDLGFGTQWVVSLCQGMEPRTTRMGTEITVYYRKSGKLLTSWRGAAVGDKKLGTPEFPAWTVIEEGVVMDLGGKIHMLRWAVN